MKLAQLTPNSTVASTGDLLPEKCGVRLLIVVKGECDRYGSKRNNRASKKEREEKLDGILKKKLKAKVQ